MIRRLITTVSFCLLLISSAQAVEFISTNNFLVASNDTIRSESWIYTQTGRVDGVVAEDAFFLADRLELNGTFQHDIWALTTRSTFSGNCAASARLVGQQVLVSGSIARSLTAVGETVKCEQGAVAKDVLLVGKDVIFEGETKRDARIIANRVTLNGKFGGDLRLTASDIVISSDCRIAGDLIYSAPQEIFLPNRAVLSGQLVRRDESDRAVDTKTLLLTTITTQALWFLGALLVGLPLISLFPLFIVMSVNTLKVSTWRCMFMGLAAFFLMPFLAIFMVGSIIGIPLALMTVAIYGILLYMSKYPVAILLGVLILRRRRATDFKGVLLLLIVGLAAVYILTALPYIGGTIRFVIAVYGLGALIATIASARKAVVKVETSAPAENDEEPGSQY